MIIIFRSKKERLIYTLTNDIVPHPSGNLPRVWTCRLHWWRQHIRDLGFQELLLREHCGAYWVFFACFLLLFLFPSLPPETHTAFRPTYQGLIYFLVTVCLRVSSFPTLHRTSPVLSGSLNLLCGVGAGLGAVCAAPAFPSPLIHTGRRILVKKKNDLIFHSFIPLSAGRVGRSRSCGGRAVGGRWICQAQKQEWLSGALL